MGFDPDKLMKSLTENNPKVLFYPSSGFSHKDLFDMNYDVFILSDYRPRTPEERKEYFKEFRNSDFHPQLYKSTIRYRIYRIGYKWIFLFFQDNNEVFERIRNAGLKISCFVGVNDGCCEGGNYECVNDQKWLKKVFALFPEEGGIYITDHSPILNVLNVYPHNSDPINKEPYYLEFIFKNWYLERIHSVNLSPFYSGRRLSDVPVSHIMFTYPIAYKVSINRSKCWRGETKTDILLVIEHDNIANHVDKLDGIVVSPRCLKLIKKLNSNIKADIEVIYSDWRCNTTECFTMKILQTAKENRWKIVGTAAYGNGEHKEIFEILDNWKYDYPKVIRIFYMDSDDFNDIT